MHLKTLWMSRTVSLYGKVCKINDFLFKSMEPALISAFLWQQVKRLNSQRTRCQFIEVLPSCRAGIHFVHSLGRKIMTQASAKDPTLAEDFSVSFQTSSQLHYRQHLKVRYRNTRLSINSWCIKNDEHYSHHGTQSHEKKTLQANINLITTSISK